jgi:hypothetical protein
VAVCRQCRVDARQAVDQRRHSDAEYHGTTSTGQIKSPAAPSLSSYRVIRVSPPVRLAGEFGFFDHKRLFSAVPARSIEVLVDPKLLPELL